MTQFQQNLMYMVLLVVIFVVCIYCFNINYDYDVKGIFLPQSSKTIKAYDLNKIEFDNFNYKSNTKNNIGQIRTSVHVSNKNDFYHLCNENLYKAIQIASDNGANEIKYICLYPKGKINKLSSVSLRAYAFKN